jgi:hypothetical protein
VASLPAASGVSPKGAALFGEVEALRDAAVAEQSRRVADDEFSEVRLVQLEAAGRQQAQQNPRTMEDRQATKQEREHGKHR